MTPAALAGSGERVRNPRGQGGRLRADILAAADALLRTTGTPESVTLRAVARAVGVATTSIYGHFADRDAILTALADRAFTEMADATTAAQVGSDDPVARLLAGCRAYLDYARREPYLYALVFPADQAAAVRPAAGAGPAGRSTGNPPEKDGSPEKDSSPEKDLGNSGGDPGARLFRTLTDAITACVQAGVSASRDPFADAAAVWAGLHGYATLTTAITDFPWPPADDTITHLVTSLARTQPPTH